MVERKPMFVYSEKGKEILGLIPETQPQEAEKKPSSQPQTTKRSLMLPLALGASGVAGGAFILYKYIIAD